MKKMYTARILSLLSLFLLFGCWEDDEPSDREKQSQEDDEIISQFLSDNNITAERSDDGIYYVKLQENSNGRQVLVDDIVSVYYRITHLDGRLIEVKNPQNTDEPLKFRHAQNALFPLGINIGVGMMREGEKFRFYLPSTLAFEDFTFPNYLGPNTILIAEVEVVEITDDDQQLALEKDSIAAYLSSQGVTEFTELNNGLVKYTVEPGSGSFNPIRNQRLFLNLKRTYLDGTETRLPAEVDENNNVELIMGQEMTDGLQLGLEMMVQGEKAVVLVPSSLAFSEYIQVFPQLFREEYVRKYLNIQDIYPFSIIKYEIEWLQDSQF